MSTNSLLSYFALGTGLSPELLGGFFVLVWWWFYGGFLGFFFLLDIDLDLCDLVWGRQLTYKALKVTKLSSPPDI